MRQPSQANHLRLILGIALIAVAAPSMADCNQLSINLASEAGHNCTLVSGSMIRGKLSEGTSFPPILSNIPQSFKVAQAWLYGPKVQLTYMCDQQKSITLTAHQKYCALKSGKITVTSSTPTTTAIVTEGSAMYATHGSVSWIVQ